MSISGIDITTNSTGITDTVLLLDSNGYVYGMTYVNGIFTSTSTDTDYNEAQCFRVNMRLEVVKDMWKNMIKKYPCLIENHYLSSSMCFLIINYTEKEEKTYTHSDYMDSTKNDEWYGISKTHVMHYKGPEPPRKVDVNDRMFQKALSAAICKENYILDAWTQLQADTLLKYLKNKKAIEKFCTEYFREKIAKCNK